MNIHPNPFFFCGTYSLWAGLGVAHRSNHHPHVFSCAPQILITWTLVSNGFHIHLWCDGNYWADGEIYVISSPSSPMSQGKWTESRFKWLKILAWIHDCSFPASENWDLYIYLYSAPQWLGRYTINIQWIWKAGRMTVDSYPWWPPGGAARAWSGQGTRRRRQKRSKQANVAKIDRRVNIAMAAGQLKTASAGNKENLWLQQISKLLGLLFWDVLSKVQRSVKPDGREMRAQHWTASISLALLVHLLSPSYPSWNSQLLMALELLQCKRWTAWTAWTLKILPLEPRIDIKASAVPFLQNLATVSPKFCFKIHHNPSKSTGPVWPYSWQKHQKPPRVKSSNFNCSPRAQVKLSTSSTLRGARPNSAPRNSNQIFRLLLVALESQCPVNAHKNMQKSPTPRIQTSNNHPWSFPLNNMSPKWPRPNMARHGQTWPNDFDRPKQRIPFSISANGWSPKKAGSWRFQVPQRCQIQNRAGAEILWSVF